MLDSYPTYNPFRALKEQSPPLQGEDVYALQRALSGLHFPNGIPDGVLGVFVGQSIKDAQRKFGLKVDGVCGPATWAELCVRLGTAARKRHKVRSGLTYGQLAQESGLRGGMYSAPVREDGTFDAGVAQLNSAIYPLELAFDTAKAIELLVKNTRDYYDLFEGVAPDPRRWGLAAGAHNAPAYASFIAREEGATGVKKSNTANPGKYRPVLEGYIKSVSAFMH